MSGGTVDLIQRFHKSRSIEHQTPLRPTGGVFTVMQELLERLGDGRYWPQKWCRPKSKTGLSGLCHKPM